MGIKSKLYNPITSPLEQLDGEVKRKLVPLMETECKNPFGGSYGPVTIPLSLSIPSTDRYPKGSFSHIRLLPNLILQPSTRLKAQKYPTFFFRVLNILILLVA